MLALRPHVVKDRMGAISHLVPWVGNPSANIRRFAIEATRPRGVWSAHIPELKSDPKNARPLLNLLMSDLSGELAQRCVENEPGVGGSLLQSYRRRSTFRRNAVHHQASTSQQDLIQCMMSE